MSARNARQRYVVVVMDGGEVSGVHGPYASKEKADAQAARLEHVLERYNDEGADEAMERYRSGHFTESGHDQRFTLVRPVEGGPIRVREYR